MLRLKMYSTYKQLKSIVCSRLLCIQEQPQCDPIYSSTTKKQILLAPNHVGINALQSQMPRMHNKQIAETIQSKLPDIIDHDHICPERMCSNVCFLQFFHLEYDHFSLLPVITTAILSSLFPTFPF